MIRGTTAQFKFKLPYTMEELEWITVKWWQTDNPHPRLPITKVKDNFNEPASHEIYVSLTAEETLRFSDRYKAKMQLRAQPYNGIIFGSHEVLITVYPMRDDIIDEDTPIEPSVPSEDGWIILDGETVVD